MGARDVRTEAVPQAVVSEAASALRQAGPRVLASAGGLSPVCPGRNPV